MIYPPRAFFGLRKLEITFPPRSHQVQVTSDLIYLPPQVTSNTTDLLAHYIILEQKTVFSERVTLAQPQPVAQVLSLRTVTLAQPQLKTTFWLGRSLLVLPPHLTYLPTAGEKLCTSAIKKTARAKSRREGRKCTSKIHPGDALFLGPRL